MSKYEPPREDGTKGYIVTVHDWGRVYEREVYAEGAAGARAEVLGRPTTGVYAISTKRKLAEVPK